MYGGATAGRRPHKDIVWHVTMFFVREISLGRAMKSLQAVVCLLGEQVAQKYHLMTGGERQLEKIAAGKSLWNCLILSEARNKHGERARTTQDGFEA